jgi:hypothetical protein
MGDRFSLPLVLFHLVDWEVCGRTYTVEKLERKFGTNLADAPLSTFSTNLFGKRGKQGDAP